MEVRPDYKQTDVGLLPEDWEAHALGVIAGLQVGYAFSSAWFQKHVGVPLLRGENVGYGRPNWSDTRRLEEKHAEAFGEYRLRPGDVVIGMDRTFTKLGTKISVLRDGDCPCLLVQRVGRFIPKKCDGRFLWALLSSAWFRQSLLAEQKGMDIPHLSRAEILRPLVAFPTRAAEREVIAEALSDADALIESLEQLLTKKRQIKQGAMQELLTGKKRLPGFSGEWYTHRLGELFALVSRRNAELNDNVLTISAQQGFVRQEEFFNKRVASSVLENYYLVELGEFAYNRSYSKGYPYGAIKRLTTHEKGVVTTLYICFTLRLEADSDPTFFAHYFEAGLLNNALATVTNEGGRAHGLLNITKGDFLTREIRCPLHCEQSAIAAVLSDMDIELAIIEAKLVKARQIKLGMMQELLPGRIRLI